MLIFATEGNQLTKATVISGEMMDKAQKDYFHKAREEEGGTNNGLLEGSAG